MYRLKMNPLSNQKAIISDEEFSVLLPIDQTKYERYSTLSKDVVGSVESNKIEDEDDNSSDLVSTELAVAEDILAMDSSSDSSPASDSDSFGGFDGGDTGGGGASSDY